MDEYQKYLDPQMLASLHGLELRARSIVEGYVAGMHRSPYHGFSVEFAEHREYVPGDDLRYVDWKVFAKTDKVYLKQYEEETNLVCYLLLDTSESMRYKSDQAALSKLEYAQCIAASLAYLMLHQQDSVGPGDVRSGNPHLVAAQRQPLASEADGRTSWMRRGPNERPPPGRSFMTWPSGLKKRGVVVILSDLFDDVPAMLAGLKHFRHRRHEVVVFHVLDPAELDFPFQQTTLFKGLEQLPDVLSEPRALRRAYLAEFAAFTRQVQQGLPGATCRLCADADRSNVGCGPVGLLVGPNDAYRLIGNSTACAMSDWREFLANEI